MAWIALAWHANAATQYIRLGKLIDGKGKVWTNVGVVVENDRIRSVDADAMPPSGAQVIDLRRYSGIPGMIDAHTHMTYYWDQAPGTTPWAQSDARQSSMTVFLAQENARKTLEAGVTTVRDLGSSEYADVAMRDLINRGAMIGPRMFVSGYGLNVTSSPVKPGYASPPGGTADGVSEVLRVVRQQVAAHADVIKMYGSTGSDQDVTGFQTFTFDEMKAAADVTHKYGLKLAVHSYGPDGARDAVRAGADSIEHSTDMDDATIAEMAKRGTFYVPTIDHNRYYVEYRKDFGYSEEVAKRLNDYIQRNLETARRAFQSGRALRHGIGRRVHRVRTEYPRIGMVCEGRYDTRAGLVYSHDKRRRATWNGEELGGRRARVLRGYCRRGGRSDAGHRSGDSQCTVGDERRQSGGGPNLRHPVIR